MTDKIAVIASSIHPIRQKHLLEWYEDLSNNGLNAQLFLGSKNPNIPTALNYKVNSKQEKIKFALSNLLKFKKKQSSLGRIQPLISYNPRIVHLLTSNAFTNIEPILENKNIKLIVSFRGFDINVFPKQSKENLKLTQRIFEKAHKLHFISKNLMNTAIQMNANPEKCVVIHRSIRINNQELFHSSTSNNEKLIILSVGRLVWEKGYLYALKTMSILKKKGYDFEYQIAGKGIDFNMLNFHVERLNIKDRVKFLGELSPCSIKKKLQEVQIYFQPSITEALSMAIMEASYFGLPIVSSNIGGIPEVVEDGVTGFLNAACDSAGYANSIINLIENEDLRGKMGNSAKKHIINSFSRVVEIKKWHEVYSNVNE